MITTLLVIGAYIALPLLILAAIIPQDRQGDSKNEH
jgi:hypothetical protein